MNERDAVMTVSPVAEGLAWVYGRILEDSDGTRRWEYLGSSPSRDQAVEHARRTGNGARVQEDDSVATATSRGIASTRPPADS
jgi:hypothetical protein